MSSRAKDRGLLVPGHSSSAYKRPLSPGKTPYSYNSESYTSYPGYPGGTRTGNTDVPHASGDGVGFDKTFTETQARRPQLLSNLPSKNPLEQKNRLFVGQVPRPYENSENVDIATGSALAPMAKKVKTESMIRLPGGQPLWNQQLCIDTTSGSNVGVEDNKMDASGYHPETEAISPTLPTESFDSKSDIVFNISQVDIKINQLENQLQQLQKKQMKLEAEAAKPKEDIVEEEPTFEVKHFSVAQPVYKENRKLAHESHQSLAGLGPCSELPLYHQPSDTSIYQKNAAHFEVFKSLLQTYFKKRVFQQAHAVNCLTESYEKYVSGWLKKVDTKTVKKNIKDQKARELYEKVFPDIKKHREDKERLITRVGARAVGGGYARSEAELEQIMDGLHEQEEEDKKMRAYAVIPPLLRPSRERRLRFINNNGLIAEPMVEYNEIKQQMFWTQAEKDIFKEKYLERPKNFGYIAEFLDKKTVTDCVRYYYLSKKSESYKSLLKKQIKRPPRKHQFNKPAIRHGNEEVYENDQGTDDEDGIVRLTRSALEGDPQPHACAVCGVKVEHLALSHPVSKACCSQYDLDERLYQSDWRVCTNCKCSSVRRRALVCPISSCTTPKRKVRHLRALPVPWADINAELKERLVREYDLKEDTGKCCSSCYDKLAPLLGNSFRDPFDLIDTSDDSTYWTEKDIESVKHGIRLHGKNWLSIASLVITKTASQCKRFFLVNKKRIGLDSVMLEHMRKKAEEQGSDGEGSDLDDTDDDNGEDEDDSSENEVLPSLTSVATADCSGSASHYTDQNSGRTNSEDNSGRQPSGFSHPDTVTTQEGLASRTDHDSSATASADEGPVTESASTDVKPDVLPVDKVKIKEEIKTEMDPVSNSPLDTSSLLALKREPGLAAPPFKPQRPGSGIGATGSTSVRDLIDFTIEDALTNPSSQDTNSGKLRNSVISLSGSISDLSSSSQAPCNPLRDIVDGRSLTPSSKIKDKDADIVARRLLPLPAYKGDPRDGIPIRSDLAYGSPASTHSLSAPPPAHSHHIVTSLDHRAMAADRKSPSNYEPIPYSRAAVTTAAPTVAGPPPLIHHASPYAAHHFSPGQHNLGQQPAGAPGTQPQFMTKKDITNSGGSNPQVTSSQHSALTLHPPAARFEAGSISHGTPRSQHESGSSSAHTPPSGREERSVRSPRAQSHVPVSPLATIRGQHQQKVQQQQLHYQQLGANYPYMMHEQQMMNLYQAELLRNFPAMLTPFQTKAVLHNDFLTAQQMMTGAADKELGKVSPRSQPVLDPSLFMMYGPRLDQHRLLTAELSRNSPLPKDDFRAAWSAHSPATGLAAGTQASALKLDPVSSISMNHINRGEQMNQQRSSIVQGIAKGHDNQMALKPMDLMSKPADRDQHASSPKSRLTDQDRKTRYEKDQEELRHSRTYSERSRTDSERTLTDTEVNQSSGRGGDLRYRSNSIGQRYDTSSRRDGHSNSQTDAHSKVEPYSRDGLTGMPYHGRPPVSEAGNKNEDIVTSSTAYLNAMKTSADHMSRSSSNHTSRSSTETLTCSAVDHSNRFENVSKGFSDQSLRGADHLYRVPDQHPRGATEQPVGGSADSFPRVSSEAQSRVAEHTPKGYPEQAKNVTDHLPRIELNSRSSVDLCSRGSREQTYRGTPDLTRGHSEQSYRNPVEHMYRNSSEQTFSRVSTEQHSKAASEQHLRAAPEQQPRCASEHHSRGPSEYLSRGSSEQHLRSSDQTSRGTSDQSYRGIAEPPSKGFLEQSARVDHSSRISADHHAMNASDQRRQPLAPDMNMRDERWQILEEDRKLGHKMKDDWQEAVPKLSSNTPEDERESRKRPLALHGASSQGCTNPSYSSQGYSASGRASHVPTSQGHGMESQYVSKRLAEISKVMQKEQMHKDASSLFSSSFEKDINMEKVASANPTTEPQAVTTASFIGDIIARKIGSNDPYPSQQTSVIVPLKKQKLMQHSHSDTDLSAHFREISNNYFTSNNSPHSAKSSSPTQPSDRSAMPVAERYTIPLESRPITLTDHIHDIITKDYKQDSKKANESLQESFQSKVARTPPPYLPPGQGRPYRVDGEPISPPTSTASTNQQQSPKPSRLSGIRSLLSATDNVSVPSIIPEPPRSHQTLPTKLNSDVMWEITGQSPMEYVKTKIEEAIRHGYSEPLRKLDPISAQAIVKQQANPGALERLETIDLTKEDERNQGKLSDQRQNCDFLLAVPSKVPLTDLSRARSPEEVNIYAASKNKAPAGTGHLSSSQQNPTSAPARSNAHSMTNHKPTMTSFMDNRTNEMGGVMSTKVNDASISVHKDSTNNARQAISSSRADSGGMARQSPVPSSPHSFVTNRSPLADQVCHSGAASLPQCDSTTPASSVSNSRNAFTASKKPSFEQSIKPLLSEQYETLSDDES